MTFVQRNFHGLTMNAGLYVREGFSIFRGRQRSVHNEQQLHIVRLRASPATQDLGITLVYDIPAINRAAQLLKGWQLSSLINVQSGQPFQGRAGSDLAGVNDNRGLFGGTSEPWSLYGSGNAISKLWRLSTPSLWGSGLIVCTFFGCTDRPARGLH